MAVSYKKLWKLLIDKEIKKSKLCEMAEITTNEMAKMGKDEMVKMETHRRLKTGEVVLIVLGFPVWFSLLLAGVAVLVSLIVVLWSLIVSLWAVFASLVACGLALVTRGIVLAALGNGLSGIAVMGAGLICAGLAIFLQFGCKAATKGSCFLTKMAVICWFRRKEAGK